MRRCVAEEDGVNDLCHECGRKLPEDPWLDAPSDHGFCDERCERRETGVNCLHDLNRLLDANDIAHWVYKNTECGACFVGHVDRVVVAGYFEDWDGECPSHVLTFPFHIDDFHAALDLCDEEADDVRNRIHEPERTALDELAESVDTGGRPDLDRRPGS